MCGIVGFVGKSNGVDFILRGLKSLNYRGYDSAGIAFFDEKNRLKIVKKCGKLTSLSNAIKNEKMKISSSCTIGHTRWATHGEPSDLNAHPIEVKNVVVVHNGIVENYLALKNFLELRGYFFNTKTDTEVAAALIDFFYDGSNCVDAILRAAAKFEGSYALAIVFKNRPDTIYAIRKGSSLNIGFGKNENYLASDVLAFCNEVKTYSILEENEVCVLTAGGVSFFNFDGVRIEKPVLIVDHNFNETDKSEFDSFMLKEIYEQPDVVKRCFSTRINLKGISFESDGIYDDWLVGFKRIRIVACGTAMYAGMFGKHLIEEFARVPVEVSIASEFRYFNPIFLKDDLVIVVSQSGETADSLAALRLAKQNGVATLGIVNVGLSSIAREVDRVILIGAGPEIAVASTKAFSAQIAIFYLLALKFADVFKTRSSEEIACLCESLKTAPAKIKETLGCKEEIFELAKKFYNVKNLFFIGRLTDYYLALEGSLKLKELSYIHSEAYAAGELKHGTISLIENGVLVVVLATQKSIFLKTLNNAKEVRARGAEILLVCSKNDEIEAGLADFVFRVPDVDDWLKPFCVVVFEQLFACEVARLKGCDVDMPRNLAKSVTVE